MVKCKYWKDCGIKGGGCCSKNLYGGKPSLGICSICSEYDGPPRGAGDRIEKFTKLTGIKSLVEAASNKMGKDCGCADRRISMNEQFPSKDHPTKGADG